MDLSQRLDEMELAIHKPSSEKEQAAQMRSTIGCLIIHRKRNWKFGSV